MKQNKAITKLFSLGYHRYHLFITINTFPKMNVLVKTESIFYEGRDKVKSLHTKELLNAPEKNLKNSTSVLFSLALMIRTFFNFCCTFICLLACGFCLGHSLCKEMRKTQLINETGITSEVG